MILGQAALLLNLLTIAALCLSVGVLAVSCACGCFARFPTRMAATARHPLLWSAVTLPWLAAGAAALILVFPGILGERTASLVHWHHIRAFNVYSWHGLSALGFLSLTAILLLRSGLQTHRQLARMRLLMQICERDAEDRSIILSGRAQAFTCGLLHPRCFYTSRLRDGVTPEEFAVVRQHEEAHARHFDPLKKLLFALLAGFFPHGTRRYLNRQMALCIEQCADEQVSRHGWSETFIAQTLLKVTRLSNAIKKDAIASPLCCHFALEQLDARIHYLLEDDKGRSFPPVFIAGLFLLLTSGCLVSADLLHHIIETLFSH